MDNLIFEVADATDLPYENHSFDVVLIANALHIMPEPEKALKEIERVLKRRWTADCTEFCVSSVRNYQLPLVGNSKDRRDYV
ncbi:MAG: class I SAM-dependent methyltransferase [Lachnospiraceae bacterium]